MSFTSTQKDKTRPCKEFQYPNESHELWRLKSDQQAFLEGWASYSTAWWVLKLKGAIAMSFLFWDYISYIVNPLGKPAEISRPPCFSFVPWDPHNQLLNESAAKKRGFAGSTWCRSNRPVRGIFYTPTPLSEPCGSLGKPRRWTWRFESSWLGIAGWSVCYEVIKCYKGLYVDLFFSCIYT